MKYLKMKWMKRIKKELLFDSIIFWSAVGIAAIFFENNILVTAVFIFLCLLRVWFYHKKDDMLFFFSGFFLGPLSEIILVYFGVWQYSNPTFLGIPLWLPLAWGLAVIMIKRLAETFLKIEIK